MNLQLQQPWFLLLIPLGLFLIWKQFRQKSGLGFSTKLLTGLTLKLSPLQLERIFLSIFLICSTILLAQPTQSLRTSIPISQQARDIVIVVDISGSMQATKDGSKLKTAIEVITEFANERPSDLLALITFDSKAYLEWPLSSDHQSLIYRLNHLPQGGGTVISNGFLTGLNHLQQYGHNSGAIIIVSDGASEVTFEERQAIEKKLGNTRVYWIWIKDDTDVELAEEFGAYVKSLDGKVYQGELGQLDQFFSEISKLESSPVVWENQTVTHYYYGPLPYLSLGSLILAAILHFLREV